jgi:parallel beta-helix repeat protein
MIQRKIRPYLSIILIILSVCINLPQTTATKNTLSTSQDTQTITLQEQINAAAPYTTLCLPSGTYQEILTINKPLHLQGNHTILQPASQTNGYAIHILAENVHLNNLEIINQAPGLYTTAVKISAPHTTIQHCFLHDTPIGIALWSSSNTITNCTFQHCQDEGIVLLGTENEPCTNNTITHCTFSQNCDGIELQHAPHNTISYCSFTQNTHAGIDAIEAANNHNIISTCTFSDNNAFGIYLAKGTQNLITHCSFNHDQLALLQAPHNTLHQSQIDHITLLDDSSLVLYQCHNITSDHITTDDSTFEIQTSKKGQYTAPTEPLLARYHQVLIYLLSNLKTFKTFLEQLSNARM